MCRIASLLALLVGVLGVLVIPAAAWAQTVAKTGAATSLREFDKTVVFSDLDRASGLWHLSVRRAGTPLVERLPVAPSPTSFEADIGPDVKGRATLVYQRCRGLDLGVAIGCDLFVYSLADATGERPLHSANDPYRDDVEPTIWGGPRIAVRIRACTTRCPSMEPSLASQSGPCASSGRASPSGCSLPVPLR
jgi:hypothetical protein